MIETKLIRNYYSLIFMLAISCDSIDNQKTENNFLDTSWVKSVYQNHEIILERFQDISIYKRGTYIIVLSPPTYKDSITLTYPSDDPISTIRDKKIDKGKEHILNQDNLFSEVDKLIAFKDSFKIRDIAWGYNIFNEKHVTIYCEDTKTAVEYNESCRVTDFHKKYCYIIIPKDSCWWYFEWGN